MMGLTLDRYKAGVAKERLKKASHKARSDG